MESRLASETAACEPLLDGGRMRDRMPQTAAFLRSCAALMGGDEADHAALPPSEAARLAAAASQRAEAYVRDCVRLAIALRRAVAADDYPLVCALYREAGARGLVPAHAVEGGLELGVGEAEMRGFAARHRAARRAGQPGETRCE